MALVNGLELKLEIIEGRNLVAKDRKFGFAGNKTTSDCYALVFLDGKRIGKTKVEPKTLDPKWNETFKFSISNFHQAHYFMTHLPKLEIHLLDEDKATADDPMGTVDVPIDLKKSPQREWYNVKPGRGQYHCHNATGSVCISLTITVQKMLRLVPGNAHPLRYNNVNIGLAWDCEHGANIDLDASCVAISKSGQVLLDQTVYYGYPANQNNSIVHSGDEQTGAAKGDDETIRLQLNRIPDTVLALYLVLSVVSPQYTLKQVRSATVRFYHPQANGKDQGICGLVPADLGQHTSLVVARIQRDPTGYWKICPIEAGVSPARDFGFLIPQIKSYTRDLLPDIRIDPSERVAIMRKNGAIRVRDFCPDHKIPTTMSFGLGWDITQGRCIDLDASVICLNNSLHEVDLVYFKKLRSNDGSILHTGDNRSGAGTGDDETINILLEAVDPNIKYIGIVVNSYSGQELDDVARANCRLYDTETRTEIARYALTDSKPLDKHTALVMGCLYRSGNDWMLRIISEAAQGRTVKDNVDELQNCLRRNPPPAHPTVQIDEDEGEIDLSMPSYVAHNEEEEISLVPISDVEEDIVIPPRR